jgi:hypothetical protein
MNEAFISACLTEGPLGHWVSATGTFDVVMREEIWFLPHGRGRIARHSALLGSDDVDFLWRLPQRGCLDLRELARARSGGDDVADAPWEHIEMEFGKLSTDAGTQMTLRQRGTQGFWIIPWPLRWEGSASGD